MQHVSHCPRPYRATATALTAERPGLPSEVEVCDYLCLVTPLLHPSNTPITPSSHSPPPPFTPLSISHPPPLLHPYNIPITPLKALTHPYTPLTHPSHTPITPLHTALLHPSYTLAYLRFVGHSSWANIKGKGYCDCYTRAPFTSWHVTFQL